MTKTTALQLNELHYGTPFRQYVLLEQVGAGGQGVVWSAIDEDHNRVTAIKFIEMATSDQEVIDDWVLEKQTDLILQLHHPNVLPLYDFGVSGQIRYLVSPYLSGGSLRNWLTSGKYPTGVVLQCAREIASALDYLHGLGLIHRDLKSGNVLMDLGKNIYVADFGLARVITPSTVALHTGRGTPPYAPPEQHRLAKISPQSDIYSFGILLYEMFTRRLPWKGEKSLGVQQLVSGEQIPDPCEIDPRLPASLAEALRRITAVDPAARPATAGEAFQMIADAFGVSDSPAGKIPAEREIDIQNIDAPELLRQGLTTWDPSSARVALSLTRFAVVDLFLKQAGKRTPPAAVQRFLLLHALIYGFHDRFWWEQAAAPRDRLDVSTLLLAIRQEKVTARVVNYLRSDLELQALKGRLPAVVIDSLLEAANHADDPWLRQESLNALRHLLPKAGKWRESAFSPERDKYLAGLAVEDSPRGEEAAKLIGHIKSRTAVQQIAGVKDADRRAVALQTVQQEAGGLPASLPFRVRLEAAFEGVWNRLLARPLNLLAAYGLLLLGVTLGFGSIAYLTYRLPAFIDTLRITVSLARGLFLGITFGFGLLVTRTAVERLTGAYFLLRLFLGTLTGSILLSASAYAYHLLILGTPPGGILVPAGCLLIALGFALGGWKRSRLWKIGASLVFTFASLAGSWWLHASVSSSPADLTPIFLFEYTTPMAQVLGMVLLAVLPVSILGNMIVLAPGDK